MSAPVPSDFYGVLRKTIRDEIAAYVRSGAMRNSSQTGGRYTIRGGALVVEAADGDPSVYFGAVAPTLPDGTFQPGFIMWREDGTIAAAMYDPSPQPAGPGDYKQFLAIYDRAGNILFSDDTDSGQGIARPYLAYAFYSGRFTDTPSVTSSGTFETLWQAVGYKQNPRLFVGASSLADSGITGEVRVLVNGTQLGTTQAVTASPVAHSFGPAAIPGSHMSSLTIQIQARVTAGTGNLRVLPSSANGFQS